MWNTPYLFNAKELDEETGLYYYGARYLDPTHAAWLSVDPLFEKYVGMTPYNYCAGNPVKLVDVDGLYPLWTGEDGESRAYIDSKTGESLTNEQVINYLKYGDYNSTEHKDDGSSDISPWGIGWEWLTGDGERNRTFVDKDKFTEMLKNMIIFRILLTMKSNNP